MPSLSFTTGAHIDYHKPSDTADKIDYEDLDRIAELRRRPSSARLMDRRAAAVRQGRTVVADRQPHRRARVHRHRSRLHAEREGLLLGGVIGGGPAEQAGLQKGDVIVEIAGQSITNIYDYTYALELLKIGQPVKVVYMRGTERRETSSRRRRGDS